MIEWMLFLQILVHKTGVTVCFMVSTCEFLTKSMGYSLRLRKTLITKVNGLVWSVLLVFASDNSKQHPVLIWILMWITRQDLLTPQPLSIFRDSVFDGSIDMWNIRIMWIHSAQTIPL
jgi:hypothetical protein